jgi:hypothetical protein
MKHLLVIILSGLLIALPSCKYFKGGFLFGKKNKNMALMKAREDSIRVADSLQKVRDRMKDIENAKLDSLRRAEEERAAYEANHKYNIIVGSFITPEYAALLTQEYRKQGYDAKILKAEGSRFEFVSVESLDNFRKALSRLRQFQDTVQMESWLYVKK